MGRALAARHRPRPFESAMARRRKSLIRRCESWQAVTESLEEIRRSLEVATADETWFRGVNCSSHTLMPSLFWKAKGLRNEDLDAIEQDAFFAFQARARELHERGLTD